jgi:protein phosphatase 1 regulatory subunit 7
MSDIISKISKDLDVEIFISNDPTKYNCSYSIDKSGNITSLFLNDVKFKSIDKLLPLAESLEVLSVENCGIENLSTISAFSNLKKLILIGNPLLSSAYRNISKLDNLSDLELSLTTIKDTSPLGSLINLRRLNLNFNDDLIEVKGLKHLNSLNHIELRFSQVENLEKIEVNENIECMNIRASEITQISGLEKYFNLKELILDGNGISKIENLDSLFNLKRLNLSSASIAKIEGLEHLRNLETLDLSFQQITKIEGLENLTNLRELDLSLNKISKLENLDNLQNLEYLLLECNKIQEFDSAWLKKLHSSCVIALSANPIKKLDVQLPENITVQFDNKDRLRKLF